MPMSLPNTASIQEDVWCIVFDGYDPAAEGYREALCALGNGYFVTRAATPDATADSIHYPGCYRAGLYNRLTSFINGQEVENESIANLPNWLPLTFRIDEGDWFAIDQVDILEYRQVLHLRSGVLQREIQFRDRYGRQTKLREQRFVSMAQSHLAALRLELTAENWSGQVSIRSGIDGRIVNNNVERYKPYCKKHLEPVSASTIEPGLVQLVTRTTQSRVEVALATRTHLFVNGTRIDSTWTSEKDAACIHTQTCIPVNQGDGVAIEKVAALYTSRDPAIACCMEASQKTLQTSEGFTDLLGDHAHSWERLWRRCDIEFEPVEYLRVTRLNLFHILQTVSPHTADLDAGVPARGWHGEDYRGHIFWDEAFVLPFLIYRFPSIARSMLLYRYRRLNAARELARQQGYRGAMFPWRSASSGGEETPHFQWNLFSGDWLPDHTHLQRHINGIIAHTIWQYYTITNDIVFLCDHGTEMLIEIARFWASRATYNAERDRYEIHNVVGPDEYHTAYPNADTPGINNNSYTNLIAIWSLYRAQEALNLLPESRRAELCYALNLQQDEIQQWQTLSRKMYVAFDQQGRLSQYEGFETLKPLDWQQFDEERVNWILEAEGDDINRYQVAKQADVAMLFFLLSASDIESLLHPLGYTCDRQQIQETLEYHFQRTTHESSLSHLIYAGAFAKLDSEKSWHLFSKALFTDLAGDSSDEVQNGIHLGAIAGTLFILQHHYLGLNIDKDKILLNPSFPEGLDYFRMRLQHHYNDLHIKKTDHHLHLTAEKTNLMPITVLYNEKPVVLQPGDSITFNL